MYDAYAYFVQWIPQSTQTRALVSPGPSGVDSCVCPFALGISAWITTLWGFKMVHCQYLRLSQTVCMSSKVIYCKKYGEASLMCSLIFKMEATVQTPKGLHAANHSVDGYPRYFAVQCGVELRIIKCFRQSKASPASPKLKKQLAESSELLIVPPYPSHNFHKLFQEIQGWSARTPVCQDHHATHLLGHHRAPRTSKDSSWAPRLIPQRSHQEINITLATPSCETRIHESDHSDPANQCKSCIANPGEVSVEAFRSRLTVVISCELVLDWLELPNCTMGCGRTSQ